MSNRDAGSTRLYRHRTALVLMMAFVVLLVVAAGVVATVVRIHSDPVLGTQALMPADLTEAEQGYVAYVEPRLSALRMESQAMARLGEERSRDAAALLEGQRHVESLITDISSYIDEHGVPDRFRPSAADFAAGARGANQSIRGARAALARLDWDALGTNVERFSEAAGDFDAALRLLTADIGATPT